MTLESDVRSVSPPLHILPDPQKGAPITELPQREMLPFRSPPTICKIHFNHNRMIFPFRIYLWGAQDFQNSGGHLIYLVSRRFTRGKFHIEKPKILGATKK